MTISYFVQSRTPKSDTKMFLRDSSSNSWIDAKMSLKMRFAMKANGSTRAFCFKITWVPLPRRVVRSKKKYKKSWDCSVNKTKISHSSPCTTSTNYNLNSLLMMYGVFSTLIKNTANLHNKRTKWCNSSRICRLYRNLIKLLNSPISSYIWTTWNPKENLKIMSA
jgi:hypothetical protein